MARRNICVRGQLYKTMKNIFPIWCLDRVKILFVQYIKVLLPRVNIRNKKKS